MLRDRDQRVVMMPARLTRWLPKSSIDAFAMDRGITRSLGIADPLGNNSWDRRSTSSYASVYMRSVSYTHLTLPTKRMV